MAMPLSDTHMSSTGINFMCNSNIYLKLANNLAYYMGGEPSGQPNKPFSRTFLEWRPRSGSDPGFRASCYLDD